MSDEYFEVYSEGVCFASVCSNLPKAAVEARMRERDTGADAVWKLSEEKFRTGQDNPCPCSDHPETHTHYLFVC